MKKDSNVGANSDEDMDVLMLGLLYLMLMEDIDMGKLWMEYVEEIKLKRRFFPKSQLLKEMKKLIPYATNTIKGGTKLYRARSYHTKLEYAKNELPYILSEFQNDFPDIDLELEDFQNALMSSFSELVNIDGKTINQRITELKGIKGSFYGYDEKGSDAPTSEYAGSGRANARYIRFLYAALDVGTAIMEIDPKIDQPISVAEIELNRDINIFDFSIYRQGEEAIGIKLDSLSRLFSSPNYNDESEYLPTQYLCEYIREQILSSVNLGHKNIVIFDCDNATKPYKISGSKVYNVSEQKIKFEQILPQY